MELLSLSDIFQKKILRIPDYQRGYAWEKEHLAAFWNDIMRLEKGKSHYIGVLTLEPVPSSAWQKWEQDAWLIDGVSYRPFYVVDGQQRLTTSMILLQVIIESLPKGVEINYQSAESIKKDYILFKAEDGQRKSFLFGYEKDNPSDEFLRAKIFNEDSFGFLHLQTLYTKNLSAAKEFFKNEIDKLSTDEISVIFKKLTQRLKYNLYEIDDEIDVFVTFETMNNRGKSLTNLELLKNRLIYLSTLFTDNEGRSVLRRNINDAWKNIYRFLGENEKNPLGDDDFLRSHWIMYFKYTRIKGDDYAKFLLEEEFTAERINDSNNSENALTMEDISKYVTSLQKSIRPWFYIHNPTFDGMDYGNSDTTIMLDRLNRLSFKAFRPLILAALTSNQPTSEINALLMAAERYNFIVFSISKRRANVGDSEIYGYARDILKGDTIISSVIKWLDQKIINLYDRDSFYWYLNKKYTENLAKNKYGGFYSWDGLHYFLFEYEQHLLKKGKISPQKLGWADFKQSRGGSNTIEHIYPKTDTDPYWKEKFSQFNKKQKYFILHSLGNLLPLSLAKNAALQNSTFSIKKNNGEGVGYYNGSAAENEVNREENWTAENIAKRGLELLRFMEERWDINIGDDASKMQLLHLEFLSPSAEPENSKHGE